MEDDLNAQTMVPKVATSGDYAAGMETLLIVLCTIFG